MHSLVAENEELRAELPPPDPMEERIERQLADREYVELRRVAAWSDSPGWMQHWDAEAGEFNFPAGWPEGVTAESYIRGQSGLPPAAGDGVVVDDESTETSMHKQLQEMLLTGAK